jgi:hypothetical protein
MTVPLVIAMPGNEAMALPHMRLDPNASKGRS